MKRPRADSNLSMLSTINRWRAAEGGLIIAACARGHKQADVLNEVMKIRLYDWTGLAELSLKLCPDRRVSES